MKNNVQGRSGYLFKSILKFSTCLLILLNVYSEGFSRSALLQETKVSGTISDAISGEVLPGVSIAVEGTNVGTVSDMDGKYSLNVSDNNAVLVFSYVGYMTEKVTVSGRTTIDMKLSPDIKSLEEVVVIGYGTVKKSDLTGSVASVKSDDLQKFPASSISEMLRGQAAGVQVTLSSARPGGGSNILIRGKRSLSGGNEPLYIVDGVTVSGIDDLNPNDIQSIEILKDASSQAIYGARAYNGVVLVTTKRGESGKISVEFNTYAATQSYHRNFDLYSPQEWVELRRQAKRSDGANWQDDATVFDDQMMLTAYQNGKSTDWSALMLDKAALQQKYDLSIKGGSDKLKAAAGFGYFNQDGIVSKSGYQRGNMRLNVDYNPSKYMAFGTNFSFVRSHRQQEDGYYNYYLTRSPYGQAYDDQGNLLKYINSTSDDNPIWRNNESNNETFNNHVILGTYMEIKPFKGFSYRLNASTRANYSEAGNSRTKQYPGSTGDQSLSESMTTAYVIDNIISYKPSFLPKAHSLELTLIQSVDQSRYRSLSANGKNPPVDIFDWNNIGDSEIQSVGRSLTKHTVESFAGRLQYNFREKYLLTASIRRDGSSVFGAENKWANFPSAAVAWRINQENFMRGISQINNLKLRASYGVVGNEAIPNYRTLGLTDSYNMLFGDQGFEVGYLPQSDLRNPALKWETSASVNFGLDFGLFNNRISGTFETFRTRTYNLLIQKSIPQITGYTTMWDNLGETKSWGYEGTLNTVLVDGKNFTWSVGSNVSIIRNKLVKIDGRVDANGKPINDLNNNWFIGEPLSVYYDYVFDGIWQTGENTDIMPTSTWGQIRPGDIKLEDVNGDGVVNADDRVVMKRDPDWFGTFYTNVNWKGIDFSAEFYTVQGTLLKNSYLYDYNSGGGLQGKTNGIKVNYWTPENPSQEAPRPYFSSGPSNFGTLAYEDASYFRLRTLTLGYTLPKSLLSKLQISKLRIYFTGSNLFTQTKFRSYSPEALPGGYPEPTTLLMGLNLSF